MNDAVLHETLTHATVLGDAVFHETRWLQNYLLVGGLLFAIGLVGFLVRRNLIVVFLCTEMMLQGIAVSLVAWGSFHHDLGGQTFVLMIIGVAAAEAALGLALFLMLFQQSGTLDITFWQDLREDGQPPYVDQRVPEEVVERRVWPRLTAAGVEPAQRPEDHWHRGKV